MEDKNFEVRSQTNTRTRRNQSGGDNLDPWSKTKFLKQLFAVFPRQTKSAHISNTEAGDDG